jgi:hypothetical protein
LWPHLHPISGAFRARHQNRGAAVQAESKNEFIPKIQAQTYDESGILLVVFQTVVEPDKFVVFADNRRLIFGEFRQCCARMNRVLDLN